MSRGTWRSWVGPTVFVLPGASSQYGARNICRPPAWPRRPLRPTPAGAGGGQQRRLRLPLARKLSIGGGGGFWVNADFLYLQPRRRAQDFAIIDPNTAGTAVGTVQSANWSSHTRRSARRGNRIGKNGGFITPTTPTSTAK